MSKEIISIHRIAHAIFVIRGQKVLLDSELAALYGVTTGNLNKAVKRNRGRFPVDFVFQLSAEEAKSLIFQSGTPNRRGGRRHLPYAFTEQGVAMLSSVLHSNRAVKVNIAIMRAFVRLREMLEANGELARKFAALEMRVGGHDKQIAGIIEAIRQLISKPDKPKREIGFHVREKTLRYRTRRIRSAPSTLQPFNSSPLSP
jgi:hypothetical protein